MNHSGHSANNTTDANVSGAGMDKQVTSTNKKPLWIAMSVIGLLALWLGLQVFSANKGKVLSINQQRVSLSTVSQGSFEDFIPVRGRVVPAKTVFLDAIEGGRVEKVLVEDGVELQAGQLIVELSNATLQLNVLGNEARVAEQLNNMRSIELNLEQNRLRHKSNLVDIEYQIKLLTRQLKQQQTLLSQGAINQSVFDDTKDQLDWYQSRRDITLESQASDTRMQAEQLTFLQATSHRLESNLAISRQNLESMSVRAPVDGKLSGFNVEIGQSIGRGERLGQIDTPNDFKVTAFIDEFYLGRVDLGQSATFGDYQLTISKIYPQVSNGQFEVDLSFNNIQPADIRRGQTIQTKLTLGDATTAVLIPNGAFYQDTGGKWIFVVNASGTQAVKRPVQLGRKNHQYIEVIEGLEVGERVVTSPYTSYQNIDTLQLK